MYLEEYSNEGAQAGSGRSGRAQALTAKSLPSHTVMLAACAADPNADIPLGRVDIPIKEILREAARPSGQRLASAAKVAYKLRQAAQRARAAVEARHVADRLR